MVETVVDVCDVSKQFVLRHNRSDSLKSRVVGLFHKRYREVREVFWALRDVSFQIGRGETVGLIGRNGSGKSTLLKILAGILRPSSGWVSIEERARIGTMIELGVGFNPELTGRENVYLNASLHGLQKREIEAIYSDVVKFSELEHFMDIPLKNYSSGMQMRLGFGVVAYLNPELLLIDEVLAVGDEEFQGKCMRKIHEFKGKGTTIVIVSHSLDVIESLCERACLLDNGRVLALGSASEVCREYHRLMYGGRQGSQGVVEAPSETQSRTEKGIEEAQGGGRWGVGGAEITHVEFLDGGGNPRRVFGAGEPFAARIFYRAARPIRSPVFGVAIHREDGLWMVGPNTKAWGYFIDEIRGEGTIDYVIERLLLVPGRYWFTAAIYDFDCITPYDHREQQFPFSIVEGPDVPEKYGLVHLPSHWRLGLHSTKWNVAEQIKSQM